MKKSIILLLCLLMSLLIVTSCVFPLQSGEKDSEGGSAENGESGNNEVTESDEFTVIFDPNDGSKPFTKVVKKGSTLYAPYYTPAKPDYLFDYWSFEGEKWQFGVDKVTSDITLNAIFKTKDYSITYDLLGGECSVNLPEKYNIESEDYILPTLTKGESFFDGWYLDGELVTKISSSLKRDITLVAKFYDTLPEIIEGDEGAKALAINGENSVTVELASASGESEGYTLLVEIPDDWYIFSASQGSTKKYSTAKEVGEGTYAMVDMISDGYELVITPITYKGDTEMNSNFGITLSSGNVVDVNYYPGFVRKAVTFTLDDGLYQHDKKVIDILKPYGFTGTFNINNPATVSDPTIYAGFEVANHHLLHTTAMRDGFDYSQFIFSDQALPSAPDQDKNVIYRNYGYKSENGEWIEGFYYVHYSIYGSTAGWHPLASDATYIEYLAKTTVELEKIFGEGSVVGFAYPHGGSANATIREYIKNAGYLYARKTGNLKDTTGFALPSDRYAWTYNADHNCLLSVMEAYDAYRDDGTLKMFAFGVHAKDFETYSKWGDLEKFAELYGNRPEDFWYATNREIFEYEDAIKALVITDTGITNPSDVDVFVLVNGEKTLIEGGETFNFDN